MIKCRNCDHEFEKGNFCPRCGTRVVPEEVKAAPVPEAPVPEAPVIPEATAPAEALREGYIPEPQPYTEPQPEYEENPYEQKYAQAPIPPQPPVQEQVQYAQPVYQQPEYQQPQQPVYQQPQQPYAYAQPPKREMTAGKIIALVASILVAVVILVYGIPYGCMALLMAGEGGISGTAKTIDTTPHASNEAVKIDDLEYSITGVSYNQTFKNKKADNGKTYLSLTINVKNTGKEPIDNLTEYQLYADNVTCKEYVDPDYEDFVDGSEIDAGKISKAELTFIVPQNAKSITLNVSSYEDDECLNMKQITFTIR